jgi:aspartyl-tRNA(Asn)/glutamyl-tRNA(Gln) amidotransferase subunit B
LTPSPKVAANWLMGPVREYLNQNQLGIGEFPLSMQTLAALTQLVQSGKVNHNVAKGQLFEALIQNPVKDPLQLAAEMNLIVETDDHELNQLMEQLMEKHPKEVERYRKGKKGLMGFFVGQMMRQLKGKADPKAVNQIVRTKLDHWDN